MNTTLLQEAGVYPPVSEPVNVLNTRLLTGEYAQESVSCFCGSQKSKPLTKRDRYGVVYAPVLCVECGLIYANPRMTEETIRKFYADDYRKIFDDQDSDESNGKKLQEKGQILLDTIQRHFDFTPTRVMDLGCHTGEMLDAFRDTGATCQGVEINDPWPDFKPDFIILHHVLEHFPDLRDILNRIRNTLSDNGLVYIGVPGTFQWKREELWQCAHTYQFCADTLSYVMQVCGFQELYCSEAIVSVWGKSEKFRDINDRPKDTAYRTDMLLQGKPYPVPTIRTYCKFPLKQRKENIRYALSRKRPDISTLKNTSSGRCVIVGGGPSVDLEVETIISMKKAGHEIFAIERMLGWCLDKKIVPNYVVCVDASEDVLDSLKCAPLQPTYLLCTQVLPAAWDRLCNHKLVIFNGPQPDIDLPALWDEYGYDEVDLINTAGSVTLSAIALAIRTGAKQINVFGFDLHITESAYVKGIRGVGVDYQPVPVTINGREMVTTAPYLAFAQDFFILERIAKAKGYVEFIKVHGDSLVNVLTG